MRLQKYLTNQMSGIRCVYLHLSSLSSEFHGRADATRDPRSQRDRCQNPLCIHLMLQAGPQQVCHELDLSGDKQQHRRNGERKQRLNLLIPLYYQFFKVTIFPFFFNFLDLPSSKMSSFPSS